MGNSYNYISELIWKSLFYTVLLVLAIAVALFGVGIAQTLGKLLQAVQSFKIDWMPFGFFIAPTGLVLVLVLIRVFTKYSLKKQLREEQSILAPLRIQKRNGEKLTLEELDDWEKAFQIQRPPQEKYYGS